MIEEEIEEEGCDCEICVKRRELELEREIALFGLLERPEFDIGV